jgi:hypothetical protein
MSAVIKAFDGTENEASGARACARAGRTPQRFSNRRIRSSSRFLSPSTSLMIVVSADYDTFSESAPHSHK